MKVYVFQIYFGKKGCDLNHMDLLSTKQCSYFDIAKEVDSLKKLNPDNDFNFINISLQKTT